MQRRVRFVGQRPWQLRRLRQCLRQRRGVLQQPVRQQLWLGPDRLQRQLRGHEQRHQQLRRLRERMPGKCGVLRRPVRMLDRSDALRLRLKLRLRGHDQRLSQLRLVWPRLHHQPRLREWSLRLPRRHHPGLQQHMHGPVKRPEQLRRVRPCLWARSELYQRGVHLPVRPDELRGHDRLRQSLKRREPLWHVRQRLPRRRGVRQWDMHLPVRRGQLRRRYRLRQRLNRPEQLRPLRAAVLVGSDLRERHVQRLIQSLRARAYARYHPAPRNHRQEAVTRVK